jgi:lipooligosaccharide transport system ATP-binding protein
VLQHVTKRHGEVLALDNVSLVVPAGQCMGLLGPNGAGKTTMMRLLAGQASADTGNIQVLGLHVPGDAREVRRRLGVVPQDLNLDPELTVELNCAVFARLYGLNRRERTRAVRHALEFAGLEAKAKEPVDSLSAGMQRQLLIARALIHRPQLLLLDEPTVGLDPLVRHGVWDLVERLQEAGVTVLLTTHYLQEAERLARTVAFLIKGRIVAVGSPGKLVATYAGEFVLERFGPRTALVGLAEDARSSHLPVVNLGTELLYLRAEQLDTELQAHGTLRASSLEDVYLFFNSGNSSEAFTGANRRDSF